MRRGKSEFESARIGLAGGQQILETSEIRLTGVFERPDPVGNEPAQGGSRRPALADVTARVEDQPAVLRGPSEGRVKQRRLPVARGRDEPQRRGRTVSQRVAERSLELRKLALASDNVRVEFGRGGFQHSMTSASERFLGARFF